RGPEKGAGRVAMGRAAGDRPTRDGRHVPRRVERGGSAYLADLRTHGVELTRTEIAALIEIDPRVWKSVAKHLDLAANGRGTPEDNAPRIYGTLTRQQQRVLAGVCEGSATGTSRPNSACLRAP